MNVNEIISETKLDPTAVIKAINRLVEQEILIQIKHKNKKLVAWPSPVKRFYFNRLKKEEEREKRSRSQREIIIQKLTGKLPKEIKKSEKLLDKNTLDLKIYEIYEQMIKAHDDNDKERWLELYEKYDKVCIKLSKLHGIIRKSTPMERKIKKFKFGLVGIPVEIRPIE